MSEEIAKFSRTMIPLARRLQIKRVYPQLISDQVVAIQPVHRPATMAWLENYRFSENSGGLKRKKSTSVKVDWKKEGF